MVEREPLKLIGVVRIHHPLLIILNWTRWSKYLLNRHPESKTGTKTNSFSAVDMIRWLLLLSPSKIKVSDDSASKKCGGLQSTQIVPSDLGDIGIWASGEEERGLKSEDAALLFE